MTIQHMVVLKLKPTTSESEIEDLFRQLAELQQCIPGITYFAAGKYASPEGLNKGFTHGFLFTFASAAARDAYLPHPAHERLKAAIIPCIDDVVAFDFEA
jgi:hypothetical protein